MVVRCLAALQVDSAPVPFDELFGDEESNPSTNAASGREKSFKYPWNNVAGDSHPGVPDGNQDPAVILGVFDAQGQDSP